MSMKIERRRLLLAAAALSLAPVAAHSSPAGYPLTRRADRLFVSAKINGVIVEALLDSAAETSLLSPALATRLGMGPGQNVDAHGSGAAAMTARLVEHVRVEAAGVDVHDATVAVIDLSDVSRRLIGRPIDLVVGREIFDAARLLIDIQGGSVRPLGASERPRGLELPLTEERGLMLMPISVEGGPPVQAEFDLGNGTGVLLSRRFAMRAGLFDGRPVTSALGGGLGGAKSRQSLMVKQLTLAGHNFNDLRADIDDAPDAHDANIGVGVLQNFRIVTDFANHKLWLEAV